MLPDQGSKIRRILVTGGEDRKVNLWAIGKTSAILSLTGHSSSIESVTLDWPEEIAVAGSASGSIKLWDLEHSKVIRTLLGHKTSVKCVEFHPFGEFFASGSTDAVVKIWDVRKKGCIQTYTGHQDAITNLRITPDGRWIATGGNDGMVKIWDMTAGKLLTTFAEPNSKVVALEFNPAEFLLATASSDRKLRFYDLQSFELVSESPPLASAPSALEFHPDGHEVMVACRDSLQVWTWEPAICQDSAMLSWPNISDIRALQDGKLIGATKDQNFVSVWGVDLSRLKPYRVDLDASTPGKEVKSFTPKAADITQRSETPSFDPVRPGTSPQDHHLVHSNSHSRQATPTAAEGRPASRQMRRAQSSTSLKGEDRTDSAPPRKSPFILGSSGDRPLNLDLSNFLQEPRKKGVALPLSPTESGLPVASTDAEIIESLEFRHISMVSIFSNRLSSIRSVKQAWDEGDLKTAVETLGTCRDPAVWVDILRVLNLKPKLMNLEIATLLLPLLNELLFEVYEDYIITACTTVRILCKSFAQVIISAIGSSSFSSPGVDFAREDRLNRCRSSYSKFQDISLTLQELKRAPGRVGMAVRETLSELQVFG
ncbi:Katanin p80 WD40 repeat-containing subunit B1 [Dinochytrium kinnereticum]|nr:Katanin p80 WD40 repeat-containing subunit B1 [Dinochytrium kinnereticum]